ncbi:MAG: hypothetical protein MHM6MM_003451 [Cercozoa sp. M6MM]
MELQMKCAHAELARLLKHLNTANGRDKLGKMIQYASRFLMWALLSRDPDSELGMRFKGLFMMTRDARKLTRLFKVLNEYATVRNALLKAKDTDRVVLVLTVLSRLGFAYYWCNDNLVYLSKAKFLSRDIKFHGKQATKGWAFGVLATLALLLYKLRQMKQREAALTRQFIVGDEEDAKKKLTALRKDRKVLLLKLIGSCGDLVVASQGSGLMPTLTGRNFHDGHIGIGGLVSAGVNWFLTYPSA